MVVRKNETIVTIQGVQFLFSQTETLYDTRDFKPIQHLYSKLLLKGGADR